MLDKRTGGSFQCKEGGTLTETGQKYADALAVGFQSQASAAVELRSQNKAPFDLRASGIAQTKVLDRVRILTDFCTLDWSDGLRS